MIRIAPLFILIFMLSLCNTSIYATNETDPPYTKTILVNGKESKLTAKQLPSNNYSIEIRCQRNSLMSAGESKDRDSNQKTGLWHFYYYNGQVESEGEYKDNIKIGSWKYYNKDGSLKTERMYSESRLQILQNMNPAE